MAGICLMVTATSTGFMENINKIKNENENELIHVWSHLSRKKKHVKHCVLPTS